MTHSLKEGRKEGYYIIETIQKVIVETPNSKFGFKCRGAAQRKLQWRRLDLLLASFARYNAIYKRQFYY